MQKGFTLVEVLATVTISTMVIFVLFAAIINFEEILSFTDENVKLQREHRLISERFARYVRNSVDVKIDENKNELEITLLDPESDETPDDYDFIEEDGIVFGREDEDNSLYYRWCTRDEDIEWDAGINTKFTSGDVLVSDLDYDINDNDNRVKIEVTLSDGEQDYTFIETFYRRNH